MSFYRVTIPVTFVIEINDENAEADPRPALCGDSAMVAVRRAMWCLFHEEPRAERKRLGVNKYLIKGKWEDMEAVELSPEYVNRPFAAPSRTSEM